VVKELRLNEFKALYKTWKTGVPPLDHLLLSFLVWIEQKLIDNRVKVELDEAIKDYHSVFVEEVNPPVVRITPSATSTSLPEMRITSAWYVDKVSERSEPPEGI
jgi:hypothetical protein